MRLRKAVEAEPEQAALKLDLALALLATGGAHEAEQLLDALPANLSTDERAVKARTRLGLAAILRDAPPATVLQAAVAANADDLRARYLLGVQQLMAGDAEAGLQQFLEMLQRDRNFEGGLPKQALLDAFRIVEDADVVGRYRRKMASLLLV
jgi:putative thioredoxin